MNDPIKDFVKRHREEFDHLEAPVLKLDELKKKFQSVPEVRKRSFSMLNLNKWLVAASILMTLTCAWFLFYSNDKEDSSVQLAKQKPSSDPEKIVKAERPGVISDSLANNTVVSTNLTAKPLLAAHVDKAKRNVQEVSMPAPDLYARLKDSTSASSRLLAILEIEKENKIDNKVLEMLALTLNHDGNTNVRLAALSLMEKLSHDDHVASLLVRSLDKQDDPMVQLGLVSILGKMKNIEIDDKLESLARSPDTFAAVRDEAYSILLKQNKL